MKLPGLDELRRNYESFSDDKLIALATEQAASLRPEALELLKQVLAERGLAGELDQAIAVQTAGVSADLVDQYADLIRNQPCPVCGAAGEKLNATQIATVTSMVVITRYKKEIKVACPSCLDQLMAKATKQNLLSGWWGIPWGIFRTTQALIANGKFKKQHHTEGANIVLKTFASKRAGRIEAFRNNPEALQTLLK